MICVVWIERAVDGTASRAHLEGTIARLKACGLDPSHVISDTRSPAGAESLLTKAKRIFHLSVSGAVHAKKERVLVGRFHPLMLPLLLWWKIRGGKSVISIQGSLDDTGANAGNMIAKLNLTRWMSIACWKVADALVIGAPTIAAHVREHVPGRELTSIPNGVFVDEFAGSGDSVRPFDSPYAVYVGNLAPWQGIEVLIEAKNSANWPDGLKLVVIGDGVDRDIVRRAQSDGLVWLGQLGSSDARRFMAHAVCALSLKRSDTATGMHGYWPFKLIESAAVGTPIITSDALGLVDAAETLGHAVVVPAQNAGATASAVKRVFDDPDLRRRLSESGKLNVRQFDWTADASKLGELIAQVQYKRS